MGRGREEGVAGGGEGAPGGGGGLLAGGGGAAGPWQVPAEPGASDSSSSALPSEVRLAGTRGPLAASACIMLNSQTNVSIKVGSETRPVCRKNCVKTSGGTFVKPKPKIFFSIFKIGKQGKRLLFAVHGMV